MIRRRQFIKCGISAAGLALAPGFAARGHAGLNQPDTRIKDPAALQEKLKSRAQEIFAANKVDTGSGVCHVPSVMNYPKFFAWDSGWNIISLSAIDPEAALRELQAVFGMQHDDGFVPHEALIKGVSHFEDSQFYRDYYDERGHCRVIDPPSFLIAAEVVYKKTKDQRVSQLLPAMQKCLDYLLGPRDFFGNGLVSIIHPWEAGTDMAPVFDEATGINPLNPLSVLNIGKVHHGLCQRYREVGWDLKRMADLNLFVFEDLCMNALTAAGALSVSRLYAAAGDQANADKCRDRARDMVAAMQKLFWDNEAGFFFPRWDLKRKKIAHRVCLSGMLPLITGLVDQDKAQRVIDGYLTNSKHFWSPWLVPFNSRSELSREPNPMLDFALWRGHCIWINMNWLMAQAAAAYRRDDLVRKIVNNTALLIGRSGFREFYDPRTGKGVGAKGFTWPALALDMIEEYGLDGQPR